MILDIFNDDAFGVVPLSLAFSDSPFVPGRAGAVVPWDEQGVPTTSIAIESIGGELKLVIPTPRGGVGDVFGKDKRTIRNLRIPHYQVDDAIMADEVQGVRAFGSESELETVLGVVNRRLAQIASWRMDPTIEHQRLGALKGVIVDGNGDTVADLFDEFGVTQIAEVDFDLDDATPEAGELRAKCDDVDREVAGVLGGIPYSGLHAFCGATFWNQLIAHAEIRETYLASQVNAMRQLQGMAYGTITIGRITFEEYRGSINGDAMVEATKCHIFPVGVAGLYHTRYAPADYVETVNTIGLPRYVKQYRMPNDKGVAMEVQSNALSFVSRPRVLIQGRNT